MPANEWMPMAGLPWVVCRHAHHGNALVQRVCEVGRANSASRTEDRGSVIRQKSPTGQQSPAAITGTAIMPPPTPTLVDCATSGTAGRKTQVMY
jgi:hypothetical protein